MREADAVAVVVVVVCGVSPVPAPTGTPSNGATLTAPRSPDRTRCLEKCDARTTAGATASDKPALLRLIMAVTAEKVGRVAGSTAVHTFTNGATHDGCPNNAQAHAESNTRNSPHEKQLKHART